METVMSAQQKNIGVRGGYEAMVWVNDDKGREFSCTLDTHREGVNQLNQLTEHEKQSCMDVSLLIGTERW
jgi:hypothetical protein